ncbi:hypothetical protein VTJ04DRAFT_9375 [Mycothermus thermophilus]|uniref:uncharacterized protein n=1 Tax=Humicola insolens TaxID=85995 RepID=UPI003742E0E6
MTHDFGVGRLLFWRVIALGGLVALFYYCSFFYCPCFVDLLFPSFCRTGNEWYFSWAFISRGALTSHIQGGTTVLWAFDVLLPKYEED